MHGLFFYDSYDYDKYEKGLEIPQIPWKSKDGIK